MKHQCDPYILVEGITTAPNTAATDADPNNVGEKVIYKNCTLLTEYTSLINNK